MAENNTDDNNPEQTEDEAPSFERSLEELEALVERMEDGELSLERSLETFERGVQLARACQKALDSAEQRIEVLSEQDDAPQPFDTEEDG